jgi:MerR family transcriptional regulator, copper efflux regulator
MELTIGKLAGQSGATVQTIRFYEREGLLDAPPRNPSGYRIYDRSAVERLQFIHRAQELGFTLKEISDLIRLQTDKTADCSSVQAAAAEKLHLIEQKAADLQRMKTELESLIHSCSGTRPIAECEILQSLQK